MEQLAATITAGKKEITVYRDPEVSECVPIVYLNAEDDEGAGHSVDLGAGLKSGNNC